MPDVTPITDGELEAVDHDYKEWGTPQGLGRDRWNAILARIHAQAERIAALEGLLEDALDVAECERRLREMAERGEKPIPWEQVERELGLTQGKPTVAEALGSLVAWLDKAIAECDCKQGVGATGNCSCCDVWRSLRDEHIRAALPAQQKGGGG